MDSKTTYLPSFDVFTNVSISLVDPATNQMLLTRSGTFGYYRFEGIQAGQSYILTVRARRFSFSPSERVIMLLDELSDVDFTALPE